MIPSYSLTQFRLPYKNLKMNQQFNHAILPQATHDELARQNFMQSLSGYINHQMTPGNKVIYEKVAKVRFEKEYQRLPQNRYEIRCLMEKESYYRWWSALKRVQQEMMWDSVSSSVERQVPALIEKTKNEVKNIGNLTLAPQFKIPTYLKAVDIHCMPGGYHREFTEDDVQLGAIYDRGVYVYGKGWLGSLNDDMGQSIIQNYLKPNYPHFKPTKILDMGCAVGHSTLPYVENYPDAEVYGIDVSAPLLRYGSARANSLNKRVYFSQQNAEKTNFSDASFDLIVSHILLHEIPVFAIQNVMQECYRLLKPGGIMIHLDAPLYHHMDLYTSFISEWQTIHNNEPFWSAMRDLDLVTVATEAGFPRNQVRETFITRDILKNKNSSNGLKTVKINSRNNWFSLVAIK